MSPAQEGDLYGRWVHAREEDTDDGMIFRPAAHAFPPSRGRTSYDLRPDGTYVERSPGPVDAPVASAGHWCLAGERLVLTAEGGPGAVWELVAVDADRLVVRRSSPGA